MTIIQPEYSIAQQEAMHWLRAYDKHLWGINANYAIAAKMLGDRCVDAKSIASIVYPSSNVETIDDKGEVHKHTEIKSSMVCKWWKNSEEEYGPRSPVKQKSLSRRQWEKAKAHIVNYKGLFVNNDVTIAFVIRHMRRSRVPADVHIVTEVFNAKRIPLRELPGAEVLQVQ